MGRVKAYLAALALWAFLGLAIGDCLGIVAAIMVGILGWVDRDTSLVLVVLLSGAGALIGTAAGIVYQMPGARARRERPRTPLEIRVAQQGRQWRAERRARWRSWWSDTLPFVLLAVLGTAAFLAFMLSCVFGVMAMMGFDDPRYISIGVAVGLVLGVPLFVLAVRSFRGGSRGDGSWSGAGDDFFDGGGEY